MQFKERLKVREHISDQEETSLSRMPQTTTNHISIFFSFVCARDMINWLNRHVKAHQMTCLLPAQNNMRQKQKRKPKIVKNMFQTLPVTSVLLYESLC